MLDDLLEINHVEYDFYDIELHGWYARVGIGQAPRRLLILANWRTQAGPE